MGLIVVTPPSELPVDLAEVKRYLRIDGNDEDDDIESLIWFAAEFVERETGQQILESVKRLTLDSFPAEREIRLPSPPLISVESVTYLLAGEVETLSAADYTIDTSVRPGRLVLNDSAHWPAVADRTAGAVIIDFTCGHGEQADAPHLFKQAVKWMVAHAYESREAASEAKLSELPFGLRAVLESLMHREAIG